MKNISTIKLPKIAVTLLLMFPLGLNFNPDRANAEIAKNTEIQVENTLAQIAKNSVDADDEERSNKYLKLGLDAQQRGEKEIASNYYYKALELNDNNAKAYMAVATLLGHSPAGITSMKIAAALFWEQDDLEGYTLAIEWLKQADSE